MKRIIITIIFVLITFISVTFAVSAILLNSDKILNSFSIISVDNVSHFFAIFLKELKLQSTMK